MGIDWDLIPAKCDEPKPRPKSGASPFHIHIHMHMHMHMHIHSFRYQLTQIPQGPGFEGVRRVSTAVSVFYGVKGNIADMAWSYGTREHVVYTKSSGDPELENRPSRF